MDAKIFRVNYKSDFILTLTSDAGWMTPFCIKFWTGAPSQAYYAQWDGETYAHCAYDPSEPTKLTVQFDDHHLPIGELKYQVAYHFTVDDFPNDTEDEVLNPGTITTEIDGETYQVMLDFTGETAPEIQFSLPAYANEAQRITNEQQRIANEEQRILQEQQRIEQEGVRVVEFGQIQDQAAADHRQAVSDHGIAVDDHTLANSDHGIAVNDHTQAGNDHTRAESDHGIAVDDHTQAGNDHTRAESDHGIAVDDHTQAGNDHTRAGEDHTRAERDHEQAAQDHERAESDHAALENVPDSVPSTSPTDLSGNVEDVYLKNRSNNNPQAPRTLARLVTDSAKNRPLSESLTKLAEYQSLGFPAFSTSVDYAEGDPCFHDRRLYKAKAGGHSAGTWNAAHFEEFSLKEYTDAHVGIFDVSANNDGAVFASLQALLSDANLNTLIPAPFRRGGITITFIQGENAQSIDNKYIQARCMAQNFTTDVTQWQEVDDEPTAGSDNLVKSGGVAEAIGKLPSVIESETDFSIEDKNGNAIVEFDDGHIRTKKFDSKIVQEDIVNAKEQIEDLETKITPVVDNSAKGLLFSDEEGNVVGGWKDGHEVSKYPSAYTTDADGVLNIEDSKGNKILSLNDGHIKTKNFSSKELTEKVNDIIENGTKKKISILFVGNSMTQDAISYLPYVLKEIAPDVNFKFYIYFTGGFTLADQYNNFIHEFIPGTFSVCENNIRWTNNTSWESTIHKSMKEWLKVIDFDILCLQDYFSTQPNDDNAVTDFNNCVNYIRDNYDGQFKVVTLFHRPRTNVFDPNGPQSTLDCFNITKGAVEKCMKQTACQSVIACGVAAYFATLDPILQPLGDIGNLTPDGSHAQDTMACVMQSFTAALWIFSELGLPYGVYNNNIRIDQTLFNAINPPGPNVGSGIIVGTDAENNEAQLVAVKAFKYGQNLVNNSLV